MSIKSILASVALGMVGMFLPVTAAMTNHVIVAFISVPLVVLYLAIGAEIIVDWDKEQ
jgi:hypothetical protein